MLHSTTRTPVDDSYVALIGKAIYIFAYYEWAIICIIGYFQPSFIQAYSRGNPITSGGVLKKLKEIINNPPLPLDNVSKTDLEDCCEEFETLIVKRNALIHAHPSSDLDGSQILSYQTKITKPLPDMKWSKTDVEDIIQEFDAAACRAASFFHVIKAPASPEQSPSSASSP
jgi:hypothetical protein